MPLKTGTSRDTFEHNVKAEVGADRPIKQALAIAYAKKREAQRRRKMWLGGEVAPDMQDDDLSVMDHYNTSGEPHTEGLDDEIHPMEYMADGGEVDDDYEGIEKEYYPGDSTRDVRPDASPGASFHAALKRRRGQFRRY